MYGRGGRAFLYPLFAHSRSRNHSLPHRLRSALEWWLRFLARAPVCSIPITPVPRERILIYTDATGGGQLAWVASIRGEAAVFSTTTASAAFKRTLLSRKTQVIAFELAALLCAVHFLARRDHDVLAFCDNTTSLSIEVRGYARASDLRLLVENTWSLLGHRGAGLHVRHVSSSANVADAPSRGDLSFMHTIDARRVPWEWPPHWGRQC